MNKDQFEYDVGVQIANRSSDIQRLEDKISRLKKLRDAIYQQGQADKISHDRQNTLFEYKMQVAKYDNKITDTQQLAYKLKKRNGLVKQSPRTPRRRQIIPLAVVDSTEISDDMTTNLDSTDVVTDAAGMSDMADCKTPRRIVCDSDVKYVVLEQDMNEIIKVLAENGDLDSLRPDVQQWILQLYQSEIDNMEIIQDTLTELNSEIDSTAKKLNERRCCF